MLGEQIKRCREKRGFTQEQLAEKIGVSIETISSIDRGIKMPRLQNFVAIANQLGVSADELLQDELDFILPQNLCFINPYYYHIIHYHY